MENIFTETMKMVAVNFATWMEDNAWTAVYSEELKKRAYVDASKEKILVHGSDYHFTTLVKECGKNLDELYEMFLVDERRRLNKLNKADVIKSVCAHKGCKRQTRCGDYCGFHCNCRA